MRISQGHLNLLQTCPRKFQHVVLDQLGALITTEQQARMDWGNRFHLLMQQQELGLPIRAIAPIDDTLHQSLDALLTTAPLLFDPASFVQRDSEHQRTLEFHGYVLTVVYDLLLLNPDAAQILDWKTYPRPVQRDWLTHDWQTRLYPFVLVETTDYSPEQVAMIYWFVQTRQDMEIQPQSLRFDYTTAAHEQTHRDLGDCLTQLSIWLEQYQTAQTPFPQVNEAAGKCGDCAFAGRCERTPQRSSYSRDGFPSLEDIQEVPLRLKNFSQKTS